VGACACYRHRSRRGVVARPAAQRGAPPAGQQQPPPFRASEDVSMLDVSVLDKNGKVVRGLTKGRLPVLERRRPQTIASSRLSNSARR
jgi:hypothetical protein